MDIGDPIDGNDIGDKAQLPFGGTSAIAELIGLRWITSTDPDQRYPL